MPWLVDGMNVIGSRPDAWWRDRDAAMGRLVDDLERWAEPAGELVTVVFDRRPRLSVEGRAVEVAYAPEPRPDAADDEIVRRLKTAPEPGSWRVVTSDRRLAGRVRAIGAGVESAGEFRARIDPLPEPADA